MHPTYKPVGNLASLGREINIQQMEQTRERLTFLSILNRAMPIVITLISSVGCIVFLKFYLFTTAKQFASDFQSQNLSAFASGDSFQIANQLNSLSSSVHWVCISASKNSLEFYHRRNQTNCDESFLRAAIEVPANTASAIKVRLLLTTPEVLQWACLGFAGLQILLLWTLFIGSRKSALREERFRTGEKLVLYQFAEQVAHDIRGPLSALRAAVSTINSNDEQKLILEAAATRISGIADDMLMKKRSWPTRDFRETVPIRDLASIIQALVDERRGEVTDAVTIRLGKSPSSDFSILGTRLALQRIFSNILDNSIQATASGEILVGFELTSTSVSISVIDSGPGISSEIVPLLFKRGATFGKKKGNGLGLSYVKETVESLMGNVELFSELGRGTHVRCTFQITDH